ncbi:carbon starvation protein A [Thalassoglobus sp. JC818]|uniref:carbon starvation CstA family protein n=1 Tax=Thalassoglobus sp. JC818 TaxID=3232136 RepID=UPI003458996D
MTTLLVAIGSFFGFIVAYHTYGRWLSQKIFDLDPNADVPSKQLRDDVDFVPTKKQIIFGHHFTSIAGTGPIVGPAIAVFWGWLPALLWVVLGSIFIGAVHDLGALVVSMRNRGQTVGEVAGRLINRRARVLFLLILFFALTIVLAIFGLVIAKVFDMYPASVLSVWIAMPIAMAIGYWAYKRNGDLLIPSIAALLTLYGAIFVGVEYFPIQFVQVADSSNVELKVAETTLPVALPLVNPTVAWTVILMAYCFLASVLPVWLLLQPRDYVNSHQLFVALILLVGGLCFAGLTGKADLVASTPAVVAKSDLPAHAPPIFPFLFITIACGACSGFHCLVSSGTSSKQVENEKDAQYVAYGSMLLEGALAVLVILACTAGVGMGKFTQLENGTFQQSMAADNTPITGNSAWKARYNSEGDWKKFGLADTVGAFVEGGANFLAAIGIPLRFGIGIIATLVACFAATTLDSATRLQRYVIQELGATFSVPPLQNKFGATATAVMLGLAVAILPGPTGVPGTGGLILWPLFGATNQLLAGLAFMVLVFYLWRRSKPVLFAVLPMLMMLLMPALALGYQMYGWWGSGDYLLVGFGTVVLGLQVWMIVEGFLLWPKVKGVLEPQLPPLANTAQLATASGSN